MKFADILSLSYRTIRGNKLRTGITVTIIALGIMALIGITTAIQAMSQKFTESFSTMGANGFTIRFKERNIRMGNGGGDELKVSKKGARKTKQSNLNKPIRIEEAEEFVDNYDFPATVGLSVFAGNANLINYGSKKTNPNVSLMGGDENYIVLNGFDFHSGRNFTSREVQEASNVCILGYDVAFKLFKNNIPGAINKIVRINGIPYRVIAVLKSKGSTFGFSRDNIVVTSYTNVERNFNSNASFTIGVMADNIHMVEEAMGEAEGLFRAIRKLNTTEQSNFVLDRSNSIAETAMNSLGFLTTAVIIIGLITLIGAAIGLMNIMLVSVTERTKEVGLIKAIGGKSITVRQQFLMESVIISILGAILGIILGILVGNLFSMLLSTGFVVPWNWVLIGIILCTAVGLLAGLYPAFKAGKLNPIEALRYE